MKYLILILIAENAKVFAKSNCTHTQKQASELNFFGGRKPQICPKIDKFISSGMAVENCMRICYTSEDLNLDKMGLFTPI